MQKIIIILGIVILVVGLIYPYIKKIGIGQLSGDIIFKSGNSTFFFPIVTCIIISIILTIIFNLFRWLYFYFFNSKKYTIKIIRIIMPKILK